MQFTDEKGKKWCYAGYAKPKIGEYIVGETGIIVAATIHEAYTWLIVRPILPTVVFGGIEFEETGEERQLHKGEWGRRSYESAIYSCICASSTTVEYYRVLRPKGLCADSASG